MRLQLLCSPFAFRTCSYKAVDSTKTKPYDRVLPYDRSSQKLILFSEMCLNLLLGSSWKLIAWKILEKQCLNVSGVRKCIYQLFSKFCKPNSTLCWTPLWTFVRTWGNLQVQTMNVSLIYVGLYAKYGLPFLTLSKVDLYLGVVSV